MFTTAELKSIDQTYFHIINAGCHSVTLQSKNTKHYWHILHLQYPKFSSCKIQHKHHLANQFHDQGNAPSLRQAMEEIKDHDYYHLHVRPLKKKHIKSLEKAMLLLSVMI